jgi:hypothetical protein
MPSILRRCPEADSPCGVADRDATGVQLGGVQWGACSAPDPVSDPGPLDELWTLWSRARCGPINLLYRCSYDRDSSNSTVPDM